MNQKLIILGCGGHARSVADIAVMNDSKVDISFYDVNAHENEQIFVGGGTVFIPSTKKRNFIM